MIQSPHEFITSQGFEGTLVHLIAHTETQAKLHQSFGDHDQWIFWVPSWVSLHRAADAIAFPTKDAGCLEMWQEHCEGYAKADLDFNFEP